MGDGLGSVVTHVVHGAAIASKLGWKFMGACGGAGKNVKMHKANEDAEFKFMFGNVSEVRPLFCEGTAIDLGKYGRPWLEGADPKDPKKSKPPLTVENLQAWARTLPPSQIYTFDYPAYEFSQENVDFFLDEPFLSTVRKSGECGLQEELAHEATEHFVPNNSTNSTPVAEPVESIAEKPTLRVVAHYRRGDVDESSGPMRESETTHPSWYFHIMGAIQRMHPGASLRAFTSCSPKKVGALQCEQLNVIDVPIWRQHGIDLHVDDEGASTGTWDDRATEEWKSAFGQWANADIFITARSSFSQSAAYFNGNCVLRNTVLLNKHLPLKHWIEIADPGAAGQDRSYMTDSKRIAGLYKSHYNVSHLRVTGQDPTLHFIEQLRRALETCLPSKLASTLAEGEKRVERGTTKVICRPTEQQMVFSGLPLSWQQRAIPEIPNDCTVLHLNGTSLAAEILPVLGTVCRRLEVVDLRGAHVGAEGARALARLL
jgi:hypothetical protein